VFLRLPNAAGAVFAAFCSRPAAQQQFKFFFAPNERSEAAAVQSLEAAFDRS
jgi:hypothetical protein